MKFLLCSLLCVNLFHNHHCIAAPASCAMRMLVCVVVVRSKTLCCSVEPTFQIWA